MPIEIDIEDIEQSVAPFLVAVATNGVEEMRDYNIATNDWVHGPFRAEKGDTRRRVAEYIAVFNEDRAGSGRQAFAGEDLEEGRFAGLATVRHGGRGERMDAYLRLHRLVLYGSLGKV